MAKSINLKNGIYIDSNSIVDGRITLKNKLQHGFAGTDKFYGSINDFKNALVTSAYPLGTYFVDLNIDGNIQCAIVQKASNNYLSFILFNYSFKLTEHKYTNGSWNDYQYLREDTTGIYAGTDLNNFITTGVHISGGNNPSHNPVGSAFTGVVCSFAGASGYVAQTYIDNQGRFYTRMRPGTNSSWTDWKKPQ